MPISREEDGKRTGAAHIRTAKVLELLVQSQLGKLVSYELVKVRHG